MRVRVVTAFCLGKVGDVYPGAVIDLSEPEARYKIRQGYVEEVPPDTKPKHGDTVITPPTGGGSGLKHFTSRDPRPATQDPTATAKRGKGTKGGKKT